MPTQAKTGPDTILPERAPALGVPVRHFAAGLLFLFALFGLAIWKAPLLVQDYLHNPATLALTHLFTLGFAGSVVTGAIYQLTPVLLHSRLHSEPMADLHLGLHAPGAALMVLGFLGFETLWVAVGGALVLTGASIFLFNLVHTFRAVERWNWHGYFIAGAILFYISTLSWGLVLALNQRYGFLGEVEGASLASHLAMGLVGWYSLMIVAVGLKLVPMFAPSRPLPAPFVAGVGAALTAGVLIFLTGLLASLRPVIWTSLVLMVTAALAYTAGIGYAYLKRRQGPLDFSVRFALTAGGAFVAIALAGLAGFGGLWEGRAPRAGLTLLFALTWIGGTILGMLLRIVPFMVWLHRFRNRLDKQEKVPFLHEMFHPALGWVAYAAWFPGAAVLSAGMALAKSGLLVAGAVLCLSGLGALAVALTQVLRQARPGTPALYPGRRP